MTLAGVAVPIEAATPIGGGAPIESAAPCEGTTLDGATTDVHLPRLRALARHAAPGLGESSVAPLVLSTLTMRFAGVVAGLVAAMVWTGLAIFRRRLLGRAIPGLMALGALGGIARVGAALILRNPALVLVQPLVTTAATGIGFCATARGERPLPMRLVGDLFPLPADFTDAAWVRRFFARLAVLWGLNILGQVAISAVLLSRMDTATYLVARAVIGWVLTGAGVGVSIAWFRSAARRQGVRVVCSAPLTAA